MFGIDSVELLLIVVVAVVVIGPKDLPRALYKVGQVVGKARAMTRHFRTGLDAMIREAELDELQKQWDKENARIMAEHPVQQSVMTEKPLVDGALEGPEGAQGLPDAAPLPLPEPNPVLQNAPPADPDPASADEAQADEMPAAQPKGSAAS